MVTTGTATDPVWTSQTRQEYARRMHVARTTISIAIARTTAITLLQGANMLTVTGHTGFYPPSSSSLLHTPVMALMHTYLGC